MSIELMLRLNYNNKKKKKIIFDTKITNILIVTKFAFSI